MITQKQIEEIRTILKKSENPLIFFDDDPDGLCSYLLIKKYIGKGKGIAKKSSPTLDTKYIHKIQEYSPDLIVALDIPIISEEFIEEAHVPILWIDHHPLVERKGVRYYNPRQHDKEDNSPASYLCYKITEEQNPWIAMVGIFADWSLLEKDEFSKKYPDLLPNNIKDPEDIVFETKLGELINIFTFILKGNTTEVNKAISVVSSIETPEEILDQTSDKGKFIYQRAKKVRKDYDKLVGEAIKTKPENNLLLFIYPSSKNSFSSLLSNEMLHHHKKDKHLLLMIGREKEEEVVFSLRTNKNSKLIIPKLINHALVGVEGYGGGHDHACGANIKKRDLTKFIDAMKEQLK
jgi:single-stranded DNA-specific DHH superfamily exonuclease